MVALTIISLIALFIVWAEADRLTTIQKRKHEKQVKLAALNRARNLSIILTYPISAN